MRHMSIRWAVAGLATHTLRMRIMGFITLGPTQRLLMLHMLHVALLRKAASRQVGD